MRVLVLYGGWSVEREVSLSTGREVAKALEQFGHLVHLVDASDQKSLLELTDTESVDVIFNALHGRWGEDGCVQGYFDLLGIPYTHSGVLASAIAMNKDISKAVFIQHNLPVAPHQILSISEFPLACAIDLPFVVKPVDEGSTKGVYIMRSEEDVTNFVTSNDWSYGDKLMIEKYIPGRELSIPVLGDRALAPIEIRTGDHEFYTYEAKYQKGGSEHLIPAPLPQDVLELAKSYALKAHQALGCVGPTRTDMRYDDTSISPGKLYILELNSQPGLTPTSLLPEAAAFEGITFPELADWIIQDAVKRAEQNKPAHLQLQTIRTA